VPAAGRLDSPITRVRLVIASRGHTRWAAKRETAFASSSYHFVTDMGTDEALTNLPGGPSESWFSRWYKSDVPLWLAGEYKRLSAGEP
jgi:penicillin G amidase